MPAAKTRQKMRVFIFALLAVSCVLAQQVEEASVTRAAPDVRTSALVPDYEDGTIALGEIVDVVVGFANDGDNTYNVTSVFASINSAEDFSYFQNFTALEPQMLIAGGEEVTYNYKVFPDPGFEENRDFVLSVVIFYQTEKETFQSTVFNQTIRFTEAKKANYSSQLVSYLLVIGFFVALGFGAFKGLQHFGVVKKSVQKPAAKGKGGVDMSFLKDTNANWKKR